MGQSEDGGDEGGKLREFDAVPWRAEDFGAKRVDHDEIAVQRQADGQEDVELVDELLQGVEDAPDDGVDLVVVGSRSQQRREAEEQLEGRARGFLFSFLSERGILNWILVVLKYFFFSRFFSSYRS